MSEQKGNAAASSSRLVADDSSSSTSSSRTTGEGARLDIRRPSHSSFTSSPSSSSTSRRPSASTFVSTRRPSNVSSRSAVTASSSPPQSPPTTPTLRSGSRNRILASASSATALDGTEPLSRALSTSPLPRALSGSPPPPLPAAIISSGSSIRSFHPTEWTMHRRQSSPSSSSRNLATMGSPEEGKEDSSFASMRARRGSVASASASVAERKKKLASAAGASGREFDGVISSGSGGGGGGSFLGSLRRKNSNAGASPNASAQSLVRSNSNSRRVPQSTSGASLASESLEVPMPASKTESPIVGVGVGGGGESTSVTSSGDSVKAAKSSLKSRLFGLRSSNGNKADSKMKKLNGSKASSRRGAAYDGSDRGDTASIASEHSGSVSQSQPEATPFFTPPLGISGGGGGGSGSGSEEAIVSSSFADSIDARLSRVDSGSRLSAGLATSPGGADATARSGISALGPSSSSLAHEPTTTSSSSRSSRGAALAGLGLESASISTSRSQPLQLSVPARDEQAGGSPTEAAGLERPRSRSPGGTMLRMDSWPPREKRSSSFVSIKASAGTGGGYRFENAANSKATKAAIESKGPLGNGPDAPGSTSLETASVDLQPNFLKMDPARRTQRPLPASSDPARPGTSPKLGSPAALDTDKFERSARPLMQRSDSSNSSLDKGRKRHSKTSSLSASRPTTSEGTRARTTNGSSFALAAVTTGSSSVERPALVKRPSSHHGRSDRESVSSLASFASSAQSVSVVPRSSSLRNARLAASSASSGAIGDLDRLPSPPAPPRMSSTKSIGKSADGAEGASVDGFHAGDTPPADDGGGYKSKRTSLLDLEARPPPGSRTSAASAAGAAGAGALAAIRARFGDGSSAKRPKPSAEHDEHRDKVSQLRSDEGPANFDAASPESMKTARAELSPASTSAPHSTSPPDFVTDMGGSLYPISSHESNASVGPESTHHHLHAGEPRRPEKSPLRTRQAAPSSAKPIPVGSPSAETLRAIEQRQRMRLALGASPPRRSIEEVAPMGAIMASSLSGSSSYDVENAVTPTSPSTLQTGMPIWNDDIKLKPVPLTAKRRSKSSRPGSASGLKLEDSPRLRQGSPRLGGSPMMQGSPSASSQGMVRLRTNSLKIRAKAAPPADDMVAAASASQLSLDSNGDARSSASQETSVLSHGTALASSASGSMAQRYMSLRKATPPAFGFNKPSDKDAGAGGDQKKTSKWKPFSGDAREDSPSSSSLSFTSKLGRKTTKSRKSDPALARPQIRRIFDGQDIDSSDGGQTPAVEEEQAGAFGEAFRRNGSTPSLGDKTRSVHSLDAAGKLGSPVANLGPTSVASPASVGTPVEELTDEMKRIIKRRNVIRELVETEKSYASDLAVVRDVYLARAKAKAGMSATSILHTPLSGGLSSSSSTPIPSPGGLGLGPPPSSAGATSTTSSRSGLINQRFPSPGVGGPAGTYSPSFASSSDPSNRSSMFTVSSQTSQTSDSSFPFSTANAPPLPATPPAMAGMTTSTSSGQLSTSASAGTVHAQSTSSLTASSPAPASAPTRPPMHVSTAGHVLMAGALGSPDAPLTPSDIRIIFAQLEQCAVFADEMAAILEGVMGSLALSPSRTAAVQSVEDAEDDRIGRAFLSLMPRIENVYTAYCSRHEASMARLQELSANSGRASAFFKDCTEVARKHTNAWDLASLLIKPVQRVLKYPLLIQQIRAATPPSHPDYECLASALEEIGRVADNINEVKKRKDIAGHIIASSRTVSSSRQRTATGGDGAGANESVVTPPSAIKKGKKLKDKSGRHSMLTTPTSDHAFDSYASIVDRFLALRRRVEQFAQQALAWSLHLRDHYDAEMRLLTQMRNVMQLTLPPSSPSAAPGTHDESRASSVEEEMAVVASLERIQAYQVLIRTVVKTSWRPMHSEIEHNIVPMTDRLLQMFDNPMSVMAKRDEREADYFKYRTMKSDRALDKRAIESVNGFIALHAQLLDELPQFIFGVLTLLDVGVQAFARIQAAHYLDVRRAVLDYWRVNSPNPNEVTPTTAGGEATIRHVHPVRAYWSAHRRTSELLETLRITSFEGNGVFASSAAMADMAEAVGKGDRAAGDDSGFDTGLLAPPSSSLGHSPSLNSSPVPSRRPSGVAGLMRTISGSFSKEYSPSSSSPRVPLPPMPSTSESGHHDTSVVPERPPLLPSLVFRTDGDDGFFIQNSPIPFLDDNPEAPKKEPYLGTSPAMALLPELSSAEVQPPPVPPKQEGALGSEQVDMKPPMSPRTQQRHKMPVLYTLQASEASPSDGPREDRMGWPWLSFEIGDKLRVLSSNSDAEEAAGDNDLAKTILFGRIDRTGKLGWADKLYFGAAASPSPVAS